MPNLTPVTLTGDAVPGLSALPRMRGIADPVPETVMLGRVAPRSRPQTARLESFVDLLKTTPKPAVDWYTKAEASIRQVYLNNRYGCCVFSGKAHNLGIWSANDPDSAGGQTVLCTDQEISDQYFAYTGGRDNGAVIFQVLDYMVSKGFLAGGKRYKITGYVSADWRSKELTQIGIDLFGCASIGINLPSAWQSNAVWDVTNTGIVGGHDVSPCGYGANVLGTNADGVVVSSWGRLYLITWAAWTSTRWLDELYFMVPEFLWTGLDQRAPSGVDIGKLREYLTLIGGGTVPPMPDPTPPIPPVPPSPPVPPVPVPNVFPAYTGTVSLPWPLGDRPVTLHPVPTLRGEVAGWQQILTDVAKLMTDVASSNWNAVYADVIQLLQDFDVLSRQKGFAPNVPWWTVTTDVLALIAAARRKDWAAVVQALIKLAADFGLSLSRTDIVKACGFESHSGTTSVELKTEG